MRGIAGSGRRALTYPAIAVVTGSRLLEWARGAPAIEHQLARLPAGSLVIHGACPCRICGACPCAEVRPRTHLPISADVIADRVARVELVELALVVHRRPADWDTFGTAAGQIRNRGMIDEALELARGLEIVQVFAFPLPEGSGTYGAMRYAKKKDVPVREWWQ